MAVDVDVIVEPDAAAAPLGVDVRLDRQTPESWPIEPGLSLPLGSQLIHEARTNGGTTLKVVEPRRRAPAEVQRRFCALAPDARPSLFLRSTPSATE